jgi:hypothetical protein
MSIENKFRTSLADQRAIVIHCNATITDGKIYRAQLVEGSKAILLRNLQAYAAEHDGTSKPFSEVSHLFDKIYDDEFILQAGGITFTKDQLKRIHSEDIALGDKVTLLLFKEVGNDSVEFKLRKTNDDVVIHIIAKVKGNKLISARPVW